MFTEIHRHFVLCKRSLDRSEVMYRHITLIEREQFEVQVLDCETVELNSSVHEDVELPEVQLYRDLGLGISGAEKEYKLSIKHGWRALDSTLPAYAALRARRAVA